MSTGLISTTAILEHDDSCFDEAELAAAAFLARYSGRTLDAYRYDLRVFFEWAGSAGLAILAATRAHIELYRATLEERGLAASTIDRRLSTVCGYYRFAHIDGRVTSNPAQYVRRPKVYPSEGRGMDRGELGTLLFTAERVDRDHAALAVLLGLNGLRVSEACATNVEDLGFDRGHRTLRILGKGNKPALVPLVPRTARTVDLAVGDRSEARSSADATASGSTAGPHTAGCARSAGEQVSEPSTRICSASRSSWLPSMPVFRCVTSRSPPATPIHERPPSTTAVERTSTGTPPTWSSRSSREGKEFRDTIFGTWTSTAQLASTESATTTFSTRSSTRSWSLIRTMPWCSVSVRTVPEICWRSSLYSETTRPR